MLSSFRLYYIQLKDVKNLWGPLARGWIPEMRARDRGPGKPNIHSRDTISEWLESKQVFK